MTRGERTKNKILETGLNMWLENPRSVNAHAISKRIGMTHANIMYHFPYSVRDAVAEHAVEVGKVRIIAQLITEGHKAVDGLAPSERMDYFKKSCELKAR